MATNLGPAVAMAVHGPNYAKLAALEIKMWQYKICPFCNKVKALLDFLKIPYETLEVNPLTKAEIKFSPDYRKVPIAQVGGVVVKDSSEIIRAILQAAGNEKVLSEKVMKEFYSPEAQRWAEWADKQLAVLLFPNITRNFNESFQAFTYVNVSWDRTRTLRHSVYGATYID